MKVLIPDPDNEGRFLLMSGEPFDDAETMIAAFCGAVAEWCDRYPDGRRLTVSRTVTIGDLVGYVPDAMLRKTTLGATLRAYGFTFIDLTVIEAATVPGYEVGTPIAS